MIRCWSVMVDIEFLIEEKEGLFINECRAFLHNLIGWKCFLSILCHTKSGFWMPN